VAQKKFVWNNAGKFILINTTMSHSKLFGFTCWMVALAGVFGGGLYLLFESGVSNDLNIDSLQWLEVAIQDLFSLSMIAAVVGFALMAASLISSLSMFFMARAAESSVLLELDREILEEAAMTSKTSVKEMNDKPVVVKKVAEKKATTPKKTVSKKTTKKKTVKKK
jgi:hypothetical protein